MERLTKALLNYNKLIHTKQIDSAQHEKIRAAYWNVINAYNNLIDSITRLKKNKKDFEKRYVAIMNNFLDNNPKLAAKLADPTPDGPTPDGPTPDDPTPDDPTLDDPTLDDPNLAESSTPKAQSTQKKSSIKKRTRTIGGYHTRSLICRSQCRTKRKRKRKIP